MTVQISKEWCEQAAAREAGQSCEAGPLVGGASESRPTEARCAGSSGSRPCPFCGDTRRPSIEELVMTYDPPNMWRAVCQCCGAEGPPAITRGIALVMWDERHQPGDTKSFCELADRLAGANDPNQP